MYKKKSKSRTHSHQGQLGLAKSSAPFMMRPSSTRSTDGSGEIKSTAIQTRVDPELRAVRRSRIPQTTDSASQPLPIRPRAVPIEKQLDALRRKSGRCPACFRINCPLGSHKYYGIKLDKRKQASEAGVVEFNSSVRPIRSIDNRFSSSYAHVMASILRHQNPAALQDELIQHLPIPAEYLSKENCQLFHGWFLSGPIYELNLTKPDTLVAEPLHGQFLALCLTESALCFGVLAAAAACYAFNNAVSRDMRVMALTYTGQAMKSMRERLTRDPEHPSDAVIATAAVLCSVQWYLQDMEALKQHINQLHTLVDIRGGLECLGIGGFLAQYIRWGDVLSSMLLRVQCRSQSLSLNTVLAKTRDFQHGIFWNWTDTNEYLSQIDGTLVAACQKTCRLLDALDTLDDGNSTSRAYWAILNHVQALFMKNSSFLAMYRDSGNINQCLVYALYIVKIRAFWMVGTYQVSLLDRYAYSLLESIKQCGGPQFWQQNLVLFIWLLCVLELADGNFKGKTQARNMLCKSLNIRFGSTNFDDWPHDWTSQIEQGLTRFIWSCSRFRSVHLRTCNVIADLQEQFSEDSTL